METTAKKNFISKLKNIETDDYPTFDKYLKNSDLWEHFFLYLLCLEPKIKWAELNQTLCLFQKDPFDQTWQLQSFPLGEKQSVIKTLKDLISQHLITKIIYAERKDLELLKKAHLKPKKSVIITEEFIYRIKDLIKLQGNTYQEIRHHINHFKKNYQFQLDVYKKEDLKQITELLETWHKEKMKNIKKEEVALFSLKIDFENSKRALEYLEKLSNFKSLVLKSNGRVIGLSVFGWLNKKMVVHYLIKALHKEYKGITEFLMHETAKNSSEAIFLNFGGYGKSESLKIQKTRLNPCKINPIYKVYF